MSVYVFEGYFGPDKNSLKNRTPNAGKEGAPFELNDYGIRKKHFGDHGPCLVIHTGAREIPQTEVVKKLLKEAGCEIVGNIIDGVNRQTGEMISIIRVNPNHGHRLAAIRASAQSQLNTPAP